MRNRRPNRAGILLPGEEGEGRGRADARDAGDAEQLTARCLHRSLPKPNIMRNLDLPPYARPAAERQQVQKPGMADPRAWADTKRVLQFSAKA